jgi:PKD repeat protein
MTLVDAGGNVGQVSHTVAVGSPLTAAFSASGAVVEAGSPVAFNGGGSNDPNAHQSITGYSWSFGDGSPEGAGVAPSHAYAAPGRYTVTLTVAASEGLTATASQNVTVVAAPVAVPALTAAQPVAGSPVSFIGGASSGASSYAWNFGDGATGSGPGTSHTYAKPGKYTVALTVTDSWDFSSTQSLTVVVAAAGVITHTSVKRVQGKYYLVVVVSRAGTVRLGSKKITLKAPGNATFKLSLSGAQEQRLATHTTSSQTLKITYAPVLGPSIRVTATVKLKG